MKKVIVGVIVASLLLLTLAVPLPLSARHGSPTPTPTSAPPTPTSTPTGPAPTPTSTPTVSGPPAPASLAPPNGAQVTVPFTISWSAVSDPSGIVAYNWQVSPSSSMSPVIKLNSTSGATQDTISGLANGTYFWRVQAVNGKLVQGAWSATQSFTVTGANSGQPGSPTLTPPMA